MPALSCIELNRPEQLQLKQLVWQVLIKGVRDDEYVTPTPPKAPTLLLSAASFVTLYVDSELRGCTGNCVAELPLWLGVCQHGYSSAFEDDRFAPLSASELPRLTIAISILSPLQPIKNSGEQQLLEQLVVKDDGLMIRQQRRIAVFLPSVWQSLPTPEQFLLGLKRKGGWQEDYWALDIDLYRFHTFICH